MSQKLNGFRCVAYARVSTFDQITDVLTVKGSLEEQEEKARKYAAVAGWEFLTAYVEPGVSGEKFDERLSLQKMLEDARDGRFDAVIIKAGDRLARDQEVYFRITKILNQYYNIQILNMSNPAQIVAPNDFNGKRNPMLIVQQGFDAMMAAFDQARRAEMMIEGKKRQARAGRYTSPSLFYGYQLEYKVVGGIKVERTPIPDPDEYWVLELLPKLVLEEGLSESEILKRLESLGARPRKAKHWSRSTLAAMISQPFYGGKVAFGRRILKTDQTGKTHPVKNSPEKMILSDHRHEHPWDWETYERMQVVRRERSTHPPKQAVSRSPLAGLLTCGYCGRSMVLRVGTTTGSRTRKDYFLCGYHSQTPAACQVNRVLASLVFEDMITTIEKLKDERDADPETFYAGLKVSDKLDRRILLEAKLATAKRELAEVIPAKMDRLNRGYLNAKVTEDQYAELSRIIGDDKDRAARSVLDIESELRKIQASSSRVEAVEQFLNEADEFLALMRKPLAQWPDGKARKARRWLLGRYRNIWVKTIDDDNEIGKGFEIYYEAVLTDGGGIETLPGGPSQ
jgi:site-specific DNA recombinase